ncbi:unnamed protein product [Rhizoctonia solani]|uniref:C2H2-type domain-containing protein n=1 Tax=Rhizoctonia solani TaxID=456999 RepID=A0A8H3E7F6_9AGAM|nr:unnamed protein product [Rhizoctonia solani]
MEHKSIMVLQRGPDGSMHVYSTHRQPHSPYVPLPMNIPMSSSYPQPSLTSYGAKHNVEGHYPISSLPMSHSYSASSVMTQAANGFSSSLPTSISAPIPIRRHTLPHIAYPEYGQEEAYDHASPQSYGGSIQSPVSVQSPNERSFSDTQYEVAASYAVPVISTPYRDAATGIESGSPYAPQRHTQEGSDGSNSGWRSVAANVIDWSGRAHGGHSRDSSSGSTASNTTAVGDRHQASVSYPLAGNHSDFPMTPKTLHTGSHHDHDYYEHPHVRSFHPASPPSAYYEAAQSPNYVLSPPYPMSQYPGSFGSPQAISPVALLGSRHGVVPKTESFEPDLASPYHSNIWQQPRSTLDSLQEDDDKDSSVDDEPPKSPSPDSSLPNTPAAVELALPPVVPSQPFTSDAARVSSVSPPPPVDFDIQITSSGNIRMPRSCRNTAPVPIPNLTKKSRGRRVPTKLVATPSTGIGKSARTFTCTVDGCGKCFNRGEHLKRHIRSIHTDEKPHVCPVQKCGKTFSRHDNLCQHMRVHGKFSAPTDGGLSDYS